MRIAENHPGLCSCCFEAKLSDSYVDFEVFWDGPVVPVEGDARFGQPSVAIDDLWLCRPCLVQAARLLGLGDVEAATAELEAARAELVLLRKERLDAVKRLDAVETAFEGRQKPSKARSGVKAVKDEA